MGFLKSLFGKIEANKSDSNTGSKNAHNNIEINDYKSGISLF